MVMFDLMIILKFHWYYNNNGDANDDDEGEEVTMMVRSGKSNASDGNKW